MGVSGRKIWGGGMSEFFVYTCKTIKEKYIKGKKSLKNPEGSSTSSSRTQAGTIMRAG